MSEFESTVNAEQVEVVTPQNAEVEATNEPVNAGNGEITTPVVDEKPKQSPEENARFAEVRRKTEAEARDKTIAEMQMEWNGQKITTYDQWQRAKAESEEQARRESLQSQGIDPKVVDEYVNNNPTVKKAQQLIQQQEEQSRFQSEANEFFEMFPGVDAKTIDPKVFQLKAEKGLSLTDAYLRVNFSTLKAKSEQEVIAKMQANSQSSPGSLSQGATQPTNSVSSMSKSDFAKLQEQVLRGERKQI